jgi:hypothetical protein
MMSWVQQLKRRKEMQRFRNTYYFFRHNHVLPPRHGARELERFRHARDRGGRWLLYGQHPDGGIGSSYHKVLTALQVCGENRAANRLCNWIVSHEMTPEGDFGFSPTAKKERYIYKNAWVVIGSHRLGRFDISQKGMDFLSDFHDATSGGFYSSPTERDANAKQDLKVVGFCGIAAVATGRMELACGVGRWLRMLVQAQPSFPYKLYTVYSRAQGLHLEPDPHDSLRYMVSSDAQGDQYFFQIGIAGAFLARLFQATGEPEWLELAKEYMRFAEVANDALFRSLRAGKVGWAAALLYSVTGENKYNEMALRVGATLLAKQAQWGSWNAVTGPRPDTDITAEMVIWLDEIYQVVAHHQAIRA